ncbi:dihydrodipicolinate synthase family protein [Segetibacter sp. 3557_3]|uniref:dihydrodipicolinate synthase family protein n=1 Tax=Segetibacter sp. 3557_3 TaxID=2547429 RepID=UPI001058A931|nr:dihydrodipicolinate synthase family protein [Segetibacter sp. 3557_3]TDH27476.1 dihydrodipicolinate synthase family protein [Segetibacter sp. 3557_3]
MNTKKYQGIVIPAVTPLTSEFSLDHGAVESMFENFYAHNVLPFILGTTGEGPSLPLPVKKDYLQKAGKLKKPGTILYAGISANVFNEAVDLAKASFDLGADVVAATLPSYFALSEYQMQQYFEQLADAIGGPLIIYNIPATTHMSIPLQLIDELSYHDNIVGTKDSERSDERLQASINLWSSRQDFSHFVGWAGRSAVALLKGSDGLIPSTGNVFPGLYEELAKVSRLADEKRAMELQRLSDVFGDLYQKGRSLGESLWALKVLMHEKGLCETHVMPPLQPGTTEQGSLLINELQLTLQKEGVQF